MCSGLKSFSVNSSYRVIYKQKGEDLVSLKIGPHEEVYK